jgi:TnpA family transposase
MHLKASIETGAVVPSVILRKPAAAGAGNVLSRALGRIERTLFTLQGLSEADPAEDEKTLNTRLDAIIAARAAEVARAVAHGGG